MSIILVGGGSRSGKSRHSLEIAKRFGPRRGFLATAQAFDDEMRDRIVKHQIERADEFQTFEEPVHIERVLAKVETTLDVLVVDCLTLWLSNIMLGELDLDPGAILNRFEASALPCILVTNEVGCGIVPENALARQFRDRAGFLNQNALARASEAYYMIFGAPLRLK